jgi:hypothetical protein
MSLLAVSSSPYLCCKVQVGISELLPLLDVPAGSKFLHLLLRVPVEFRVRPVEYVDKDNKRMRDIHVILFYKGVSRDVSFEGLNILTSTFCVCADGFQDLPKAFHYTIQL